MKKIYSTALCLLCSSLLHAQSCNPATAFDYLDINNVKARINNGGDMWWDLTNSAKYIVPKTGNVSSLFAGALWIGGLDAQGNLHMAAQTYRQNGNDFFPGPLDASGNVMALTCYDFDRIWKVNKSTIDSFNAGLFVATPSSITQWPGKNNPNLSFFTNQDLAPFVDMNADGEYNPADGDFPSIPGDQALWFVFNDNGNTHTETGGSPFGIEVQCMVYGFKDPGACTYSTTFYHYRLINKSQNNYDSVYMGLWTDPDLGCYTDDYMGCDSANNMGIIYNATATDAAACQYNYGNQPPVLGIQILKGPLDQNGNIHYMDHCMYYVNDFSSVGNPETAQQHYQYLQSIFKTGSHLINPVTNQENNYAFSDDPPVFNGWSMCAANAPASDFRIIVSSGPVTLKAGAAQTLDYSVVWDKTSAYPCPSFATIDSVASCVKDQFNTIDFTSGTPVISSPSPSVTAFPNPASLASSSSIKFSAKNMERLEIFDVAGRKVFATDLNNENSFALNANELGKGFFIYRVSFSNHVEQSGKLIVQ